MTLQTDFKIDCPDPTCGFPAVGLSLQAAVRVRVVSYEDIWGRVGNQGSE